MQSSDAAIRSFRTALSVPPKWWAPHREAAVLIGEWVLGMLHATTMPIIGKLKEMA